MIKHLTIDKSLYPYRFAAFYVTPEKSEVLDNSCRGDFYTLFFVKSGEVNLQIDTNNIDIKNGECAFIGINQVFKIQTSSTFQVLVLRFEESFYCRHDVDINFLNSCRFFDNSTKLFKYKLDTPTQIILEQHYKLLSEQCTQPFNELTYLITHNSVERLLLYCQKESLANNFETYNQNVNPDNELANNFRQLVKENFKKEKQLSFYIKQLNISTKKLTEATKAIYGISPKKLITDQISLEAKRLLLHSPKNIKEIAFELNFEEPSNFIRFFSKSVGMSPKEYRDYSKQQNTLLPEL